MLKYNIIFKLISTYFNNDSGKLIDVNEQTNFWKERRDFQCRSKQGNIQFGVEDADKFPQHSSDRHCHLSSHPGDVAADCWYRFLCWIK
jgi:hypothetical protein